MASSTICQNRKAHFNYDILEKFEAGIVLSGSEVKSLRAGGGNLSDSYAHFHGGELWLANAHIAPYGPSSQFNHAPTRLRKLLMQRRELDRLSQWIQEKGLTLIPISLYFKAGKIKIELGLGRGKKLFDKRETIRRRETDRELKRIQKVAKKFYERVTK